MPLEELQKYTGSTTRPIDFENFWQRTLADNPFDASNVTLTEANDPLLGVKVWDMTFGGYAGDPIKAWVIAPKEAEEASLPAIVQFNGYGGGRGLPADHLRWAAAGYVHVIMDTRGQGSAWGSGGQTPDPHGSGPAFPGVMTKGIENAEQYYYRRLFVDAHHAVEAAATLPFVNENCITVTGHSQGGAMTIAAAALNHRVVAAMPDEPFLCDFPRAIGITPRGPYTDVVGYLKIRRTMKDTVLGVLAYFDGVHLATLAQCPTLFSVALMDDICPPSTVYAAFNAWGHADSRMEIYDYNGHEGGETYHWYHQVRWLAQQIKHS